MIDKKDIYRLLEERRIEFNSFDHKPVFTVEEADSLDIPYKEYGLKNLFLKDKKKQYYLVSLHGDKNVDMKRLKDLLLCTPLHFASEDQLKQHTGLDKGHVTPFGALNCEKDIITVVFDNELKGKTVGIHPMKNDATVFMNFDDLYDLITEAGYEVKMIDI